MERLQKKGGSRIALYLILLVVAVAAMVGIRHCRHSEGTPMAADSIAVAIQYSPVSFFMDGDTLGGFDYSLLRMTGLPVKLFPVTDPEQGLVGLDEGRYDMVVADFPQSAADSGRYLFTEPAYIDRQVLVQLVDSAGAAPEIASVLQLDGDTVYVTKGSPMAARLENIAREIGGEIHVVELPTTSEKLLLSQVIGDIDGPVVVNEHVAKMLCSQYPRLDCSVNISFSQFQPWILRLGEDELLNRVNHLLDSIKATPAYEKLTINYL